LILRYISRAYALHDRLFYRLAFIWLNNFDASWCTARNISTRRQINEKSVLFEKMKIKRRPIRRAARTEFKNRSDARRANMPRTKLIVRLRDGNVLFIYHVSMSEKVEKSCYQGRDSFLSLKNCHVRENERLDNELTVRTSDSSCH